VKYITYQASTDTRYPSRDCHWFFQSIALLYNISISILPLLQKPYEPTGVVVTEISLPVHPRAVYISLTLKYFEGNLMMATSGRNM
jgi:hypothetical protein